MNLYPDAQFRRTWSVTNYTPSNPTTILSGIAFLDSLLLSNTGTTPIKVQVMLDDAIIFQTTVVPGPTWVESLPAIPVLSGQVASFVADAPGLHLVVGGSL